MNIRLRRDAAEAIGLDKLEKFGVSDLGWMHRDQRDIDLGILNEKQLNDLYKLLEKVQDMRAVKVAMHDIRRWQSAQTDAAKMFARDAKQMAGLLKTYLMDKPGHRLYRKRGAFWFAYYLDHITYVEKVSNRYGTTPAHVVLSLFYEDMGGKSSDNETMYEKECKGVTPSQLLSKNNLFIETKELREQYIIEHDLFREFAPKIGMQMEAWGDSSENADDEDDDNWWKSWSVNLGTEEEPSRAVIDVYTEEKSDNRHENKVGISEFWGTKKSVRVASDDDEIDVDDIDAEADVKAKTIENTEIPVHPFITLFSLNKHMRVRHHVMKMRVHKYDKELADKLVLKDDLKALISLLIEHQGSEFQDIIAEKGKGAVVLLCGKPGTGKTLTAEVYAESAEKALYSIQCSQLGLTAETIEKTLLNCFKRAKRWGAVMLLDEADVYIHKRGDSIRQNAIVGVFLRVLEYQDAVLFMTTNRQDDVDDAIASRCIAKLVYEYPDKDEQARLWTILGAGKVTPQVIKKILTDGKNRSGRDVKNLVKLSLLTSQGKPITADIVAFVEQFKPTAE